MRAKLHNNCQHPERNLQMPRIKPGPAGMQIGYLALAPTHYHTQFFRPFGFFSDPPWETELHHVFEVCIGSMSWREIVAVGRSVHPEEKYTVFQLEWITTPISDTNLPSTPKSVHNMEEVECHLRGPLRIHTLVSESLKKYIFLDLMPNSVPLLNFTISSSLEHLFHHFCDWKLLSYFCCKTFCT